MKTIHVSPTNSRDSVARRLQLVQDTINETARSVNRDPRSIRLIAVTKTVPLGRIREAIEAGAREIGESRLQEALPKLANLESCGVPLRWHFIGRLQRRKVKTVVHTFDMIHSLESVELAEEVNRRAGERGIRQKVLLEVNLGGESSKGGFSPSHLLEALPELDQLPSLQIEGLMTIPPYSEVVESSRPYFRELRNFAASIMNSPWKRIRMQELSMGMSQDYPVAIEEGATMVRVGTAVFGARHG